MISSLKKRALAASRAALGASKSTRKKLGKAKQIAVDHAIARGRAQQMRVGTVLYETFDGSGFLCNPERIFRELVSDPRFEYLEHIWVEKPGTNRKYLLEGLRPQTRIHFVKYRSVEYYNWLGRAQYLINNSSFPSQFNKKPEQTYVNTWHGVPLKKMGYDIPGGRPDTRNVVRNLLAADFVISTGPWMTRTMYANAFRLEGLFEGKVLETGYPRTDSLFNQDSKDAVLEKLADHGINPPEGAQIVLWCPTWRGNDPYSVSDDSDEIQHKVDELQNRLGSSYFVLAKLHQLTLREIPADSSVRKRLVPNDIPVDEVLCAADHLVTDYSSVFFDFLVVDRPVYFMIDDLKEYSTNRGLYSPDPNKLPGEVVSEVESLAAAIRRPDSKKIIDLRHEWRKKYMPLDDGLSAKRVVDSVFGDESRYSVELPQRKTKILIHAGSLIPNGITSAALALISNLDYDRFDVTVLYPFSKNEYQYARSLEIDSRARVLPRVGRTAMKVDDRVWYTKFTKGGGKRATGIDMTKAEELFQSESRRCFGDSRFDIGLAFDGYQVFWAELVLASCDDKRFIWAHNDLLQDAERTIDGKQPHRKNLHSLFSLYNDFDGIVSVTPELSHINAQKLGIYAPKAKFVSVHNFLRPDYVRAQANENIGVSLAGQPGHRFITVARLSPEKNQARIIRSFAQVAKKDPLAGLTIVGDGPLKDDLCRLVKQLKISDRVYFSGLQSNPFPWIQAADAFVFASLYEGQGLAILEALMLGKWVISTEFNVVHEVLKPGQGSIVSPSDTDLAEAMLNFTNKGFGEPAKRFDPREYNVAVAAELDAILK